MQRALLAFVGEDVLDEGVDFVAVELAGEAKAFGHLQQFVHFYYRRGTFSFGVARRWQDEQAVGVTRHAINFKCADRLVLDAQALFVEDGLDFVDAAFVFARDIAAHRFGDAVAALAHGEAAHGTEAFGDEVVVAAFGGNFVDAGEDFGVDEAADVFRHDFVKVGDEAVHPFDAFFFFAGQPQRQAIIGEADDFGAGRQEASGGVGDGFYHDFCRLVAVFLPDFAVVFDPGVHPVAEYGFWLAAFLGLFDGGSDNARPGKAGSRVQSGTATAASRFGAAEVHLQSRLVVDGDAGNADIYIDFAAVDGLQFKAFARHDFFFGRFFQERLDAALAFVRHEAHQGQFVQRGTVFDAEGV